jgi:hypothetical protein
MQTEKPSIYLNINKQKKARFVSLVDCSGEAYLRLQEDE